MTDQQFDPADPSTMPGQQFVDGAGAVVREAPAEPPKMTGQEIANSLTGFEEIAIKQAFGASLDRLDPLELMRACVFALLMRRPGEQRGAEVYMAVMQMPRTEIETFFADDDEPDDGDRDPFAGDTSPAGKGSPSSAS